jgi:hypothetical protein
MAAMTSPVVVQCSPNAGLKFVRVKGSMATSETFDASSYFSTIYGLYINNATGAVKTATFDTAALVTVGTLSTGVHCMLIWGV